MISARSWAVVRTAPSIWLGNSELLSSSMVDLFELIAKRGFTRLAAGANVMSDAVTLPC